MIKHEVGTNLSRGKNKKHFCKTHKENHGPQICRPAIQPYEPCSATKKEKSLQDFSKTAKIFDGRQKKFTKKWGPAIWQRMLTDVVPSEEG
jgi:hypothetical protein